MAIIGFLTLIVAIVGLVVYLVCTGANRGAWAEVGKICFFCGLLAFLFSVSSSSCSVGTSNPPVKAQIK